MRASAASSIASSVRQAVGPEATDGQVDEHLAAVVATATLFRGRHRDRELVGQSHVVGQVTEQARPRVGDDTLGAGGHCKRGTQASTLHLGSALLFGSSGRQAPTFSLSRRAFPRLCVGLSAELLKELG